MDFGITNITISVYKIGVNTSQGIQIYYLDNPSSATVHAVYGGGSGASNDPYIITCARHFKNLSLSNSNSNYFKITTALTLEGNVVDRFQGNICNTQKASITWTPKQDTNQIGIIINNYGTISNLQIKLTNKFNISNLSSYTIGGIACYNNSKATIENCSVSFFDADRLGFTVTAGGVAGVNYGTISNCWVTSDVTTYGTFGVIAGINYGDIDGCCGMGNIVQSMTKYDGGYELSYVGGIAGVNNGKILNCVGGTMDDSYLNVTISVSYVDDSSLAPYSGPIAGKNNGTITNCSNYGYVINTGNLHTAEQLKNINNII